MSETTTPQPEETTNTPKPSVEVTWATSASLAKDKRRQWLAFGCFILAVILAVTGIFWAFTGQQKTILKVGEAAFAEQMVEQMVEERYAEVRSMLPPESDVNEVKDGIRKAILRDIIQQEVLRQSIAQYNITIDDAFRQVYVKRLEEIYKRPIDELFAQDPKGELQARDAFEALLLRERLFQVAVIDHIQISDEEIKAEQETNARKRKQQLEEMEGYVKQIAEGTSFDTLVQEHSLVKQPSKTPVAILQQASTEPLAQALLTTPEGATTKLFVEPQSAVIIKVLKRHPAEVVDTAAQQKQAEDIRQLLLDGEDFAKLAKEFSACPSKENGGALGSFTKGQMVPAFEEAAFSREIGAIGPIIRTQYGYHILKVTARDDEKGRCEASHILISAQPDVPESIELQSLLVALAPELTPEQARMQVLQKRAEAACRQFIEDQKRRLGVTCPDYPELVGQP